LAQAFVDRYLRALDERDKGAELTGAWAFVFQTICAGKTSVLEELVFSMAAHLIQDLPAALVEVRLQNCEQVSHVHDFHRMNDILAESIDDIQDRVARRYSPYLHWIDTLARHEDEILTNYGFRLCRGLAWYNANRLMDLRSKMDATRSIAESPIVFIEGVLHPPFWSTRIVLRALRFLSGNLRRWPARTT